jgi:hypothetical protein
MESVIDMPVINTAKADEAVKEAALCLSDVKSIAIRNPEQLKTAGDISNKIKTRIKELDTDRKELTRPLDDVKAKIMDKYRPAIEQLTQAQRLIDGVISDYLLEQRRIQQEQQRKVEEEARKERERAEAKAKEWAAKGNEKKAEEWLDKSEAVIAPVIQAPDTKAAGISTREDWDFEITDANLIPRDYLIPDDKTIRAFVKATKGKKEIPGVKIIAKTVIVKGK